MREIKFRAYNKELKKWEYIDLFADNASRIRDEIGAGGYYDKDSVGQYTGLKDKNGKEIYEGDLIDGGGFGPMEVKFGWYDNGEGYYDHDCGLGFYFENKAGEIIGGFGWDQLFKDDAVIGNIYENPDMLKNG